MARKRKRVPKPIWLLFGAKARTLAKTIMDLIPTGCSCKRLSTIKPELCLHCCFHQGSQHNPSSYLLRLSDPPEYMGLLDRTFVVIPDDAPALLPGSLSGSRSTQFQGFLQKTVQMFSVEHPESTNLIVRGYDKLTGLIPNAKLLSSSAWDLVLQRAGEMMMNYLLLHTSIFVLGPCGNYQQVAGPPASGLTPPFPRNNSVQQGSNKKICRENEHKSSQDKLACSKKRRRGDEERSIHEKRACILPSQFESPQNSSGLVCPVEKNETQDSLSTQSEIFETNKSVISSVDTNKDERLERSDAKPSSSKRGRPPKWVRERRKFLSSRDASSINLEHTSSISPENLSQCSRCSIFETSSRLPKDAQMGRSSILYNLESSQLLLPKKHILHSTNISNGGIESLMRKIFGLSNSSSKAHPPILSPDSRRSRSHECSCLYRSLQKLLKVLVCRARRCKYEDLLDKHCPIPTLMPNEHSDVSTGQNSRHQVVSFVWAACRSIVPPDLLGSSCSTWRTLMSNISKFIQLRRFEKFTLKQCMSKLKMSEFPALSRKHCLCFLEGQMLGGGTIESVPHSLRCNLFERWIFWLFSDIVGPIVQANFYVTEHEHGKLELYFYRKSVWKKISDEAIASLTKKTSGPASKPSYRVIDEMSVKDVVKRRSFGFSKLRFCPKEMGVRAIANLRAASRFETQKGLGMLGRFPGVRPYPGNGRVWYMKSVNGALRDTFSVLRDLKIKEPEKWGASVFDYNDVYEKLCPFLMSMKEGMNSMPTVYIVVSDVKNAYDTIVQNKLLEIVDQFLIKNDYYPMQRFHEIACTKKSLRVSEKLRLMDKDMKSSVSTHAYNSIVVDQAQRQVITKEEIRSLLFEHLKRNLLKVNQRYLIQDVGIPQGSAMSSLLCSLYFGNMERETVFPSLKEAFSASELPQHTLLRFIDDFLFITPSRKLAADFFQIMKTGFSQYNCYMNEDKFCLNFDVDNLPGFMSKRLLVGDDGISFIQWSGLLINSRTLEVQADYTTYLSNHLSSTLHISWEGRPIKQLKEKLRDYLKPKCHHIFYDSNLNSPGTVRLNIYQVFLLCAMKFHCYVRESSSLYKFTSEFCFEAIMRSVRYMHKLIMKKMSTATLRSNCKPIFEVAIEETVWLGLTAYTRVLNRKQSAYKDLLHGLRFKLTAQGDFESCPSLMYAVDDAHSSVLWKVKF